VTLNGTPIKMFNTQVAKDPAGGPNAQVTTYMPIYYVSNILQALNINGKFSGQTGLQVYSAQPGLAVKVTGVTMGNGTAANPYLNTTGDTATVWLQLADANGNPVPNAPVSLTFSGGSVPTVEQNNSYVTVTAGSGGTYTAQVTTDANGTATFVVTGQGAYTLTIAGTGQYAGSSQTIYLTLANNNPVIVAGNTSPTVSTASNITQGLVPVTVTIPGASANQAVNFYLTGGASGQAHFVNAQGAQIGSTNVTNAPTGSNAYEEYTAYTNSSGQATVYVNSYYTGSYTVYAVSGSNTVSTTISYQAPAASSTTSVAGLSVATTAPSQTAVNVSSISGVNSGSYVYVAPLSSTSNPYDSVVTQASVAYSLQTASGQQLSGLKVADPAVTGGWQTIATLPASATAAGATVQISATYNSNGTYTWSVNGVQVYTTSSTSATPVFSFTVGTGGQVTVSSGSAKATVSFATAPQTPAYVGYLSPNAVNVGSSSQTVQFTVYDTSGNPVVNAMVPIGYNPNSDQGLFITQVDGQTLMSPIGTNGANVYTPIYLGNTPPAGAGYSAVNIPGLVYWTGGSGTLLAETNSSGVVTLTLASNGVYYYNGSTNTLTYGYPTTNSTNAWTYFGTSSQPSSGVVYIGSGAPSGYSTAAGSITW